MLPYPWDRLPRLSRDAVGAERRLRRALLSVVELDRLAIALSEIVSGEVRIGALSTSAPATNREGALFFETVDGGVAFSVEPEAALASLVLARVLRRPPALAALDAPLDASTRGALSAIAVEVARRAGGVLPLRARSDAPEGIADGRVDATVTIDERAYYVAISVRLRAPFASRALPDTNLRALGDLPIAVPVVAAASLAERDEVAALAPGDVWLPGDGWLSHDSSGTPVADHGTNVDDARRFRRRALARGALCPADSERGVEIGRTDAGPLVLRGDVIALGADPSDATRGGIEAMNDTEDTLTSIALDAPIVVRVEVGSVTLTARQWASLRPGDVLETGLRLSEPAVLRVAGREVARGELVSVDGELGVRIRVIVPSENRG